jgi:fumarylacetoacetase
MDYVDFYASENHASNVGRIFRPDGEALTPNWKHMPIGYHGRAGTIVASGSDVRRPSGQVRAEGGPRFGPTERLDFEAEVGFVVGAGSEPGKPVSTAAFREHVFGICLLNDWSARDIQAWESVPLGPFLGKSFATSVSAWVTPLEALDGVWCSPPPRTTQLLPYLEDGGTPAGLGLELEVSINGCVVSRPPFATMYWTVAQFVAHTTVNGAHLRTGDLLGSGTVSGPEPAQRGSLLELSWAGTEPIPLADGTTRRFLLDGDDVVLRATAVTSNGPIGLGEVRARVLPTASALSGSSGRGR